jgi:hypothetical protein
MSGVCGLSSQTTKTTIEELLDAGTSKIDRTLRQLPKDFPEAIATSIAEAAKRRLGQFLPASD